MSFVEIQNIRLENNHYIQGETTGKISMKRIEDVLKHGAVRETLLEFLEICNEFRGRIIKAYFSIYKISFLKSK